MSLEKNTIKVVLRSGQHYTGPKGKGALQEIMLDVVWSIIKGKVKVVIPEATKTTITFRAGENANDQLQIIAAKKNISVQELLRLGLEQFNLVTRP